MQLRIQRKIKTANSTIGELFIDGKFECYTLEDVIRPSGVKVYGQTAIPAGTYNVVIEYSPKFDKRMPHIQNVPNYSGILLHAGNSAADTEGCVLVGQTKSTDFIGQSKLAFEALFRKLDGEKSITLEIG